MRLCAEYLITSRECLEVPPEQPKMLRVCAWCETVLGERVCEPAQAGTVTHGICPACAEKFLKEASK